MMDRHNTSEDKIQGFVWLKIEIPGRGYLKKERNDKELEKIKENYDCEFLYIYIIFYTKTFCTI